MTNRSMRLAGLVCGLALLTSCPSQESAQVGYPYRFVYMSRALHKASHVDEIRDVAARASRHGFNGIVLSSHFDRIAVQSREYLERLERVNDIVESYGMALVPRVFSVGHGAAMLDNDLNLAAAVPVRDQLFVVRRGRAAVTTDPPLRLANGGFESHDGHRASSIGFQDRPGESTYIDKRVAKSGRASLRIENFDGASQRFGRVSFPLKVRPFRSYRFRCWVKTERLDPPKTFLVQVLTRDSRQLMTTIPDIPASSGWREVNAVFNSLDNDEVLIYAGVWAARGGRFWIDDMQIEEAGLLNVLRRPGTPVTVRGEASGVVYQEGEDYEPIVDDRLGFVGYHDGPPIRVSRGSRIREGERLRVDYYQGLPMGNGQIGVCVSEPKTAEIWRETIRAIDRHISPRYYFIGADEVRHGGWCAACEGRGLSAGEILGDAVTRQAEIIRHVNPNAEIFIWSDMFDPNHNAKADYYLAKGDFAGSWNHIPKDLIIACWHHGIREKSLEHFDELGFRTMASAYDDTDMRNLEDWIDALQQTRGGCGIMYTTWQSRYGSLEAFGDLLSRRTGERGSDP